MPAYLNQLTLKIFPQHDLMYLIILRNFERRLNSLFIGCEEQLFPLINYQRDRQIVPVVCQSIGGRTKEKEPSDWSTQHLSILLT